MFPETLLFQLQDGLTMPNKLVARMEGPHGTWLYRCEVTIETPRFITKDMSKNVTVVGKFFNRVSTWVNTDLLLVG